MFKEQQEYKVLKELQVFKALKAQPEHKVLKVQQELKVYKVLLENKALKELKAAQELDGAGDGGKLAEALVQAHEAGAFSAAGKKK